jgi:hypothetical protein
MNVLTKESAKDLVDCPYCNNDDDVCMASLTSIRLKKLVRLNRCSNDNYDSCALFLAKRLRLGSRRSS